MLELEILALLYHVMKLKIMLSVFSEVTVNFLGIKKVLLMHITSRHGYDLSNIM